MRRAVIYNLFSSALVFGFLFETATSAKDSLVRQVSERRRQLVDILRVL